MTQWKQRLSIQALKMPKKYRFSVFACILVVLGLMFGNGNYNTGSMAYAEEGVTPTHVPTPTELPFAQPSPKGPLPVEGHYVPVLPPPNAYTETTGETTQLVEISKEVGEPYPVILVKPPTAPPAIPAVTVPPIAQPEVSSALKAGMPPLAWVAIIGAGLFMLFGAGKRGKKGGGI